MARELVLWTHEAPTSTVDAILNYDLIPDFDPSTCLVEIDTRVSATAHSPNLSKKSSTKHGKRVVVSPISLGSELKRKTPNLQLSLFNHLASAFGVTSRSIVTITCVKKCSHVADYMVLYFKDQYISRSDMWRAACNLEDQCIYVGKRITFTGGIRAEVREIWRGGKKKFSAYVSATTKPVFRSESARYLIFIQMSKEMWEFEDDGELFYNKAVDGFLPELFKRWKTMNAHHLVSIVLFTRVTYKGVVGPFCLPKFIHSSSERDLIRIRSQLDQSFHNDFYKIVVDNVSSNNWESTLTELKRELHGFARDVLRQKMKDASQHQDEPPVGQITAAMEGNVLEAINLAAHQFNRDYIDRDLLRTGTSMLFVTAGTGIFQVDEKLLKLTGESLLGNGIGMDIVCLSRRPLHVAPLFKYKKPASTGEAAEPGEDTEAVTDWEYILPYITEISYYGESYDSSAADAEFQPKLKMHGVQMMNKIELDRGQASIEYLAELIVQDDVPDNDTYSAIEAQIARYDESCFDLTIQRPLELSDNASKSPAGVLTPGEEIIKLLGTSLPSSGDKTNFHSLYELSKGTATTTDDGVDVPQSKASGLSNISGASVVSARSTESISPGTSVMDSRTASPVKHRSTFARFMHRLADRSEDPKVESEKSQRSFVNPVPGFMTLKSKPSIGSIGGAVTISSALEQNHATILTKGFDLTNVKKISTTIDREDAQRVTAIPIQAKGSTSTLQPIVSNGRKLMTSIDLKEAKAQSVSQSLRGTMRERRHSSNRSRNSLAIKYKQPQESIDASPWHILANPCYPSKNFSTFNTKAWRWAHVSDRARRTGDMNWESMCAPAALPLTSSTLIDLEDLKSAQYSENSYSIYIDPEDQPLTQKELLREMIGQRLVQGYQLASVIRSDRNGHVTGSPASRSQKMDTFRYGPLGQLLETVFLTHAQMEVHCITCDSTGHMIEVTRYVRKRDIPKAIGYSSLIWQLAQDDGYEDSVVVFRPMPTNHSWNYVDQVICGVEKRLTESVRFWRARLLFIPNDSRDKRNPPPIAGGSEQFTEEEIRLAGINKICELLQKAIYRSPGELRATNRTSRTKQVSVGVTFSTLDPTSYILHELQHFSKSEHDSNKGASESSQKVLHTSELSLYDFSNEMQAAKGIQIKDRLWHWRWYESSWIGSDFVTWLIERTDLSSREEASRFAQGLMDQGLFEHVQRTHGFLDGFYLYRLKGDYTSKTAKTWFGTRKVTPSAQVSRNRASSNVSSSTTNSPIIRPQKSKQVFELSKWIRIDVDPHRKSQRPEFVSVHYDRYADCLIKLVSLIK